MEVIDDIFVPSEKEIEEANQASRIFAREFVPESPIKIQCEHTGEAIEIHGTVFGVLIKVLSVVSEGKPFALISTDAELSTRKAAETLNVSRRYLNNLLESGEIQHQKVGKHRMIKFGDLIEYKARQVFCQKSALQELADEAQELDMGY